MNDRYEINTNSFFFFYTIQYIHSSFVHVSERRQRSQKICSFRNILFVSENNAQMYLAILEFQYVLTFEALFNFVFVFKCNKFSSYVTKNIKEGPKFFCEDRFSRFYSYFLEINLKTIHTETINKRLRGRLAYSTNSFEIYTIARDIP